MRTRIEILKDSEWVEITLMGDYSVKYNAVINLIGNLSSREISHTNTFSIPYVSNNVFALGLNTFNKKQLAKALNSKYEARYYVDDLLIQQGYIVINNTNRGTINNNFIDAGLDLIEKWGTITYQEMIRSNTLTIPYDYKQAIIEMQNYVASKTSVIPALSKVGDRDYPIAAYPNNLNSIGDKFQLNANDVRINDAFNPYQSRPIFNLKSVFDLAAESFGYTPEFSPEIDWNRIALQYIVDEDNGKGSDSNGEMVTKIENNNPTPFVYDYATQNERYYDGSVFQFNPSVAIQPNGTIIHKILSTSIASRAGNKYCLIVPNLNQGNIGSINLTADFRGYGDMADSSGYLVVSLYWSNLGYIPFSEDPENSTANYILQEYRDDTNFPSEIESNSDANLDITIDKALFDNKPTNAGVLFGFIVSYEFYSIVENNFDSNINFTDVKYSETYLDEGELGFDANSQYGPENLDLTHAAPKSTIKQLLSAAMQKEGILLSINNKAKTIKYFSYGTYEENKKNGIFLDWSKYHLPYEDQVFNTDYGSNYAKTNAIALSDPFSGNIAKVYLQNQGQESKYQDYVENYVSLFKDISDVKSIANNNTPYFEYTNEGLGLVEFTSVLGELSQQRADGTEQGKFSGLKAFSNVNYSTAPHGVIQWYRLVDDAIKVPSKFLLPASEIKNLDLSIPIFVENLGGYYIIEEVAEYINSSTPVVVKLIKLVDGIFSEFDQSEFIKESEIKLRTFTFNANKSTTLVYDFIDFDTAPTTIEFTYQEYNYIGGVAVGAKTTLNAGGNISGSSFTVNLTEGSIYRIQLTTNLKNSIEIFIKNSSESNTN
ncbi:structural protein [Cellulophaga phage phi13:1]|uniref:Structural protein n=1 Tax=Cellulophaga phage phi13:1 TaxID=1327992 RepID=S0A0F3_9CAUD|nr:structural protein [Cellulophaga phage phi13:1]